MFVLLAVLSLAGTRPALANQVPGPYMLLSLVSILPLMILLTLAGGGYRVLHRVSMKHSGWVSFLAALILIVVAMTQAGITFLVTVAFGLVALIRGVRMLRWGHAKRRAREAELLAGASAWRLQAAGMILVLFAVGSIALAIAFVGYWPVSQDGVEQDIVNFVAYQLAYDQEKGQFDEITGDELRRFLSSIRRIDDVPPVEYGPGGKSFVLHVPPSATTVHGLLPLFPFNHLAPHPTYRADASGEIRMTYSHLADGLCPPDAPLVRRVYEAEVEEARAKFFDK